MANLDAIYQELGLDGIIPHASRQGSKAHMMILDKIKQDDELFFLQTQFTIPFITVHQNMYHMMAYTTEQEATATAQRDIQQRQILSVEPVPTEESRKTFFQAAFDSGIQALHINDSLSIPISQLYTVPNYDGQPNENFMLRNSTLNGATYYYTQFACAQMSNTEAENRWAALMEHGKFLIAVKDAAEEGYPTYIANIRNTKYFLAYTDWRLIAKDFSPLPAALVISFEDLESLLATQKDVRIMLNHPTCHIVIDKNMIDTIKRVNHKELLSIGGSTLITQKQKTQIDEEEWENTDPTPDWLK